MILPPAIYSMMTYDAVMALGIGCQAKADLFTVGSSRSFKQVEFDGATGISFDKETGKQA
jgi:hypothetical protein